MKTKLLLLICLVFVYGNSFAQKSKHQLTSGKVIFDISFPDAQFDDQTMAAMPTESVLIFKDDMSKVILNSSMYNSIIISDNKTGEGTMLMDMMGNKISMKMNREDIQKEKSAQKPKVELTRESKVIAGYTCYKAIVTIMMDNTEKTFDVWFTNEIGAPNGFRSQIEGINGFMMEFIMENNGMTMKMTARSVEPMEVSDSEFTIPEGYKMVTMDDLRNMGGK